MTTTKWKVTIVVITGYNNNNYEDPILRYDDYTVEAETENEAIEKAKQLDQTKFSVYETYADTVE